MPKKEKNGQNESGLEEGQETDGQEEQVPQYDLTELVTKLNNVDKTTQKWASEMGEVRKVSDNITSLTDRLSSIEDKLSSPGSEDEVDLFDPKQQKDFISSAIQENLKPFMDNQKNFITTENFTTLIEGAQKAAMLKDEFTLSDKEVQELQSEATEKGSSIRELAYDKFSDRKFKKSQKKKVTDDLKNELNNDNNNEDPPDSSTETIFDKSGLSTNQVEFDKMYDDLYKKNGNSNELVKKLIDAGGGGKT